MGGKHSKNSKKKKDKNNYSVKKPKVVDIKRSLIMFLINNSAPAFKRFEDEISNFNDTEIMNLFEGKMGEYSSIDSENQTFAKLLDKFNNFNFLLENWYDDDDKRDYIKELWGKNMCLEIFRDLSESAIKDKLPSINDWASGIQEEFFNIVRDYTEKTRVFLNQDHLDEEAKEIAKMVNSQYNAMQNENISDTIKNCLNKGFDNVSKFIISLLVTADSYLAQKGINQALSKKIIEKAENTLKDTIYGVALKSVGVQSFKNVSINWKSLINSKYIKGVYAITSFADLCNSIYKFYETSKKVEQIVNYRKRLDEIEKSFNSHCEAVKAVYGNDIIDIIKKIKEAKDKIEIDYQKLLELIKDIKSDIEYLKKEKKKSGIRLASSILLLGAGIGGAVASGGVSLLAGVGVACNLGSGAVNVVDLVKAEGGIKELTKLLDEAEEQKKKMEEVLNQMKNTLKSYGAEYEDLKVIF